MATYEGSYVTESTSQNPEAIDQSASEAAPAAAPAKRSSGGGLGGKVLAELQEIAAGLGIDNIQGMRKGALIDAIKEARGDVAAAPKKDGPKESKTAAPTKDAPKEPKAEKKTETAQNEQPVKAQKAEAADKNRTDQSDTTADEAAEDKPAKQNKQQGGQPGKNKQQGQNKQQGGQQQNKQQNGQQGQQSNDDDDDEGSGRRRNRRGRNRNRGMEAEPTYSEDDVLVPAAGILDILDNYAFVRTTGYLPSEQDVYVSLSMVRKWGLRRGDAVTGQVRQPREGERKEKFNPMVKVESVNGLSLDDAAKRVEYDQLTAVHPAERLRLDSATGGTTARVIDLVAPAGKGQRGLVVSAPGAGKTTTVQQIANAVTENHPECHLMVVLVDQRPEEVTDFQRSVKGEVVASAFDHPAGDHTTVAELAIERAKRLVELGHDVVVLLDGVTRLGRAYLQTASGSNRGGGSSESGSLLAVKRFFGAARNVEDGGSLTIIATADQAGAVDVLVLDELAGTSNWVLALDADLADQQVFPAVDVLASQTRHDDALVDGQESQVVRQWRRSLTGQDVQVVTEQLIDRVASTSSNAELLLQLNQS